MTNQSTPIVNQFVGMIKTEPFENSIEKLEKCAESVIRNLDLNIVKKVSHMFLPQGITLVYILFESHIVVHTWPELGIIHVDMVTCSLRTKKEFESSLKYAFTEYSPSSTEVKSVEFDKL